MIHITHFRQTWYLDPTNQEKKTPTGYMQNIWCICLNNSFPHVLKPRNECVPWRMCENCPTVRKRVMLMTWEGIVYSWHRPPCTAPYSSVVPCSIFCIFLAIFHRWKTYCSYAKIKSIENHTKSSTALHVWCATLDFFEFIGQDHSKRLYKITLLFLH